MSKFIHKKNFYSSLYEQHFVPNEYTSILYKESPINIASKALPKSSIRVFEFFPNYLKKIINDDLRSECINQKTGFAIDLDTFNSFDDYMKDHKSSFRKVINRSVKRLQSCFNINYKMFYGNIGKEDYNLLMNRLYEMIETRFKEREGRNTTLNNWDHYLKTSFDSINTKKASLFVIYNDNEPIEISLNFHCNNIMYSAISSYDLDYGKFSLGNIEIFKQLEWCFENQITFFDMGYGDFDYKRRWSNFIYNFETHVIAAKNNPVASMYAYGLKLKIQIINYLISKKINDKLYNFIDLLKRKKTISNLNDFEFTETTTDDTLNTSPIDIKQRDFLHLKKPIFDFLYKNATHLDNITVFQSNEENNTYFIKEKQSLTKLRFSYASN